jgi:hypothetical protein
MQLEFERRDDAEIAAAADSPPTPVWDTMPSGAASSSASAS